MDKVEHFERLVKYYEKSKPVYNYLLNGSKHLGFHPKDRKVKEKEAQLLMQDLVEKKLGLLKGMNLLDAGCGQGVVSTYLAGKLGCRIEGITMVPFEVSRARELAKKHNVSNMVNYSVMDYSNTKFSEKSFDAIYTTESLVHSPDVKKTLREFYRILKQGGRIAMFETSIAEDTKLSEYERYIVEKVIFSVALAGQKQIRNDRFVQVMKRIGFKNIRSENLTENVAPSVQRLVRFFTIPYFFVKLLNLQSQFPNLTGVLEFAKLGVKGLFRYNAFTAKK